MTTSRLVSGRLALLFAAAFGANTGFYLLMSALPLYVGAAGAGIANGLLLVGTVLAELLTPALTRRFGHRATFAAGLLLLGVPALLFPFADGTAAAGALSFVRGIGFGLAVVVGGALVPLLVPAERRGEGMGISGVVSAVPAVLALPLGVWLARTTGFIPVFVIGAVAPLLGLLCLPALPPRAPQEDAAGMLAGLRDGPQVRTALTFGATAMAAGAAITFLPLTAGGLAPAALLLQSLATTYARWHGGRLADRRGPRRLIGPALVVTAAGTALLALGGAWSLPGAALFGAGFGVAQTSTLLLMLARVGPSGYGTVSALWNLAFDAGMAAGAATLGVAAGLAGYPAAYLVTAAVILAALTLKGNRDVPRARHDLAGRLPGRTGRLPGTADGSGRSRAA